MITIKEIAELAGVSRGTVDRVLNKRGGVNRAVEEKISAIARKRGYRPNRIARALVKRKRYTVGVISATVENVFFRDVLEGIRRAEEEVRELGVSLRYAEVANFSVADQLRRIDEMLAAGIDALAINPINAPGVREALNSLARRGVPVVTFNSDIEDVEKLAYIGCDYRRTGRIAAGLLAQCAEGGGDVRLCAVIGSARSLGHSLRLDGFREELEHCPAMRIVSVLETRDDEEEARKLVGEVLAGGAGVNAFFFAAGGKAGGIRAIRESARKRGGAARIVTVDLDPFTRRCLRDGTVAATISQQPFVQGAEPVRQLANYLLHGEEPAERIQYTRAEIVIRQCL